MGWLNLTAVKLTRGRSVCFAVRLWIVTVSAAKGATGSAIAASLLGLAREGPAGLRAPEAERSSLGSDP